MLVGIAYSRDNSSDHMAAVVPSLASRLDWIIVGIIVFVTRTHTEYTVSAYVTSTQKADKEKDCE